MNLLTVFILAIGLCFDSFAVSLSSGMARCEDHRRQYLRFALILALFQGVMPLVGWFLAAGFQQYIVQYDHWIAFVLLALLGIKMIRDSLKQEASPEDCRAFDLKHTLLLGLATSIDALITGMAMALVSVAIFRTATQWQNMLGAAGIIFAVTWVACLVGLVLGKKAGRKMGKKTEIAGGIILICIGLKILLEHLLESC